MKLPVDSISRFMHDDVAVFLLAMEILIGRKDRVVLSDYT
jgi:hypothetical protein